MSTLGDTSKNIASKNIARSLGFQMSDTRLRSGKRKQG